MKTFRVYLREGGKLGVFELEAEDHEAAQQEVRSATRNKGAVLSVEMSSVKESK